MSLMLAIRLPARGLRAPAEVTMHEVRTIRVGAISFGTIPLGQIHLVPKLLRLTHTRCPFPITI
jgi:hypothetical protein